MSNIMVRWSAIGVASIMASPLFLAGVALDSWMQNISRPLSIDIELDRSIIVVLPILIMATLVGAIIAVVPCLVGTYVLALAGNQNVALRLPIVWGLVGALLILLPIKLANPNVTMVEEPIFSGLIIAAIGSALLCRRGASWRDEPLAESWLLARRRGVARAV
ncbi:MAG: hypothetical protein K2P68_04195 [Sphingomonas sp.]|nr:hypothetical protein [Sphingomonas sp.]